MPEKIQMSGLENTYIQLYILFKAVYLSYWYSGDSQIQKVDFPHKNSVIIYTHTPLQFQ